MQVSGRRTTFHTVGLLLVLAAIFLTAPLPRVASAQDIPKPRMEIVYNFLGGLDGARSFGSLVWYNKKLEGITSYGGTGCPASGCGVATELTPPALNGGAWKQTTLHLFNPNLGFDPPIGLDGAHPYSGLTVGSGGGALFGTTLNGGGGCPNVGCGSVYQLRPPLPHQAAWREAVIHTFANNNDGVFPAAGVIQAPGGSLYGATTRGGNSDCDNQGCGVIYRLAPPPTGENRWVETVLYRFTGGTDGYYPFGGLIFDGNGGLYGTTFWGGAGCAGFGCGTVFHLTPKVGQSEWTHEVIHEFSGPADGSGPSGTLSIDGKGHLFGTTTGGGGKGCPENSGCGTVFELVPPTTTNPKWGLISIHRFQGGTDGAAPYSGLTFTSSGLAIYGTTVAGGITNPAGDTCEPFDGCGTIYRLHHSASQGWQEDVLYRFQASGIGASPYAGVILDSTERTLYGVTGRLGYRGSDPCQGNGCGKAYALRLN